MKRSRFLQLMAATPLFGGVASADDDADAKRKSADAEAKAAAERALDKCGGKDLDDPHGALATSIIRHAADEISERYVERWNAHDAAGLAALWSHSAIYISAVKEPGPSITADYEALFKTMFRDGFDKLERAVVGVVALSPYIGIGTSTYHYTGKSPEGTPIDSSGYFMETFSLEKGFGWRINMQIPWEKPNK
jgi:ketosteroid isomerase-like protein